MVEIHGNKLKGGITKSGNLGKIGLAISEINPDILYAAIELERRERSCL